jgi:hypothetical protein
VVAIDRAVCPSDDGDGLVFTSREYTKLVRGYGLRKEFFKPHCPQQNGDRPVKVLWPFAADPSYAASAA